MDEHNISDQGLLLVEGLFENNHAVMLLVDPEAGQIIDANPAACSFYGWSRDQLREMTVAEINTASAERVAEEIARASGRKRSYFVFRHRLADGSERDVEVYSGPVLSNGRRLLLSIVHDITVRTRVQAELKESEKRLSEAEKVAGFGNWSFQLDSGEAAASMGALRIYGMQEASFVITAAQAAVVTEDRARLDDALRALVEDGEPYDLEFRIHRLDDGEAVDIHSIAEYDPEVRVVFGVLQDITARKAAQRELEHHQDRLEELVAERTLELETLNTELVRATEAKNSFLASMSHELRTPLNSVIGFAGVLSQDLAGPLTDEQRVQIGMISSAGKHLLELVNELLDLAHVESGEVRLRPEEFDILSVVDSALQQVRSEAEAKGLSIEMVAPNAPAECVVSSDPLRVEQILLNLLGNAVKFTDKGSVTISAERSENRCLVHVTDTGRGIRSSELSHIFDDYYQGRHDDIAKARGVGLGLALSKRLAGMLGGDIEVESVPGQGSRFTLALPASVD